jgi:uncharacterized membrane protein YgaE (UPF0421/DUF939 family)
MLEPHERQAIVRLIRSQPRPVRESIRTASMYAAQVVVTVGLLLLAYKLLDGKAVMWALVAAVLVVQPAFEQSIAASVVRVAANTIAGIVGILMAHFFGDGVWQMLAALVIVVIICERLRLDLGLRTACVSLIIIMMNHTSEVFSTGTQRLGAVVIGCVSALLVQLAFEAVRKHLARIGIGWASDPEAGSPGSAQASNTAGQQASKASTPPAASAHD